MNTPMSLEQVRDRLRKHADDYGTMSEVSARVCRECADALDAAIAARGEAVAWRYRDSHGHWRYCGSEPNLLSCLILKPEPLYTQPPAPQVDEIDYKSLLHEAQEHHDDCIKDAYKLLGVDGSDGEFRYKWVALEIVALKQENEKLRSAPKVEITDAKVDRARTAYIRMNNLNDECEDDTEAWRAALQAAMENPNG